MQMLLKLMAEYAKEHNNNPKYNNDPIINKLYDIFANQNKINVQNMFSNLIHNINKCKETIENNIFFQIYCTNIYRRRLL